LFLFSQPNESLLELEKAFAKTKFVLKPVFEDDLMKNLLLSFAKMDVVEYEVLFQNILYFVGVVNTEINEEETNKIQWKKARKFWKMNVFESLKNYNPLGPKGKVNSFAMVNRLITVFGQLDSFKGIETYSFALSRLLEFMQTCKIIFNISALNQKRRCAEKKENNRNSAC
jgi:hypothetical protein